MCWYWFLQISATTSAILTAFHGGSSNAMEAAAACDRGILIYYESLLSCWVDEKVMMEDMIGGLELLRSIDFVLPVDIDHNETVEAPGIDVESISIKYLSRWGDLFKILILRFVFLNRELNPDCDFFNIFWIFLVINFHYGKFPQFPFLTFIFFGDKLWMLNLNCCVSIWFSEFDHSLSNSLISILVLMFIFDLHFFQNRIWVSNFNGGVSFFEFSNFMIDFWSLMINFCLTVDFWLSWFRHHFLRLPLSAVVFNFCFRFFCRVKWFSRLTKVFSKSYSSSGQIQIQLPGLSVTRSKRPAITTSTTENTEKEKIHFKVFPVFLNIGVNEAASLAVRFVYWIISYRWSQRYVL